MRKTDNKTTKKKKIVIFASGNGTNTENIINYFENHDEAKVSHVFSNNSEAKVLRRAFQHNVTPVHFDRESFYKTDEMLSMLQEIDPDLIVLAGFLWIVPAPIIKTFPDRIVNVHPSLLPKFGGKGMYGDRVHRAVLENNEPKSGITIHYVNEKYDEGEVIAQFETEVESNDTVRTLRDKIQILEYENFPKVIHQLLK
ncbi:MAG: phosphoribosylglycinamide formyltransferase [Bacteroidota bacterium]